MNVLSRYLGFALILALIVSAQSMAVARGATSPAGQIVLCTGHGPVTVFVDEDGQPVDAPHICPDCLTNALASVLPPVGLMVAPVSGGARTIQDTDRAVVLRPDRQRRARSPPISV